MPGLRFGPAEPFSFELLIERAKAQAAQPYVPPPTPAPDVVKRIDYDAHGKLRFRPEYALFGDGPGAYPVTFQFLGGFFPKTVQMHAVEGGQAREIVYSPDYFTVGPGQPGARAAARRQRASPASGSRRAACRATGPSASRGRPSSAPPTSGRWASWVRSGMSARGLALNVASSTPEEFPDFVAHWIAPAASESDPVIVHSLLDGPSVCGAYRFMIYRDHKVVMDIENHLFLRKDVERLGIAPLTSMFWYARIRPREDRRLAAGGARFRRARDLERRRRAHLAPAQQPDRGSSTPAISTTTPRASA